MKPYELISSEVVYKGKILSVKRDVLAKPGGGEMLREIVVSREAAAIVPIDEDGHIIFVRQYRHAIGGMAVEIPAGIVEEGETPEECARRELREETGYTASHIKYLTELRTTIGFCTETIHIFVAGGLTGGKQKLDPDEFVTIEVYSPQEAIKKIRSMEIVDGKTIAGVMLYCSEE